MSVTQAQIDELLATLKALFDQITPLRRQADDLHQGLSQVKRDYDQRLGEANSEADRLELLKASLQARLAQRALSTDPATSQPEPELTPPPEVADITPELGAPPPAPPPEDPRAARKRALADHIFYFIDSDQSADMQIINTVLADDRRDIGDMLEMLAWGTIWTSRADWETPDDQYARLEGWRQALEERLAYWQREVRRIQSDPRYALLLKLRAGSQDDWLAYLDDLTRQQEEDNARLATEVAVLEREWQAQQVESEAAND